MGHFPVGSRTTLFPRHRDSTARRTTAGRLALLMVFLTGLLLLPGTASPAAASSTWEQLGSDIAAIEAADQSGYRVAMDADGSRLVVGAPLHDGGRGTVRVYDWNGSAWTQVGADIDGEAAGDQFGFSVSISSDGSRVAIGARFNDGTTGDATDSRGHVRVYDWNGSAWTQVGADIDGSAREDYAGVSVSLSSDGSRVAFGAEQPGGNGYVRVLQLSGTTWTPVHSDVPGETNGDLSGRSVSLSSNGSRVAIGAVHNDGNGINSGNVRIFEATGSGWVQMGGDIDGEAASDETGQSVSLSSDGTRVAVGAPLNDGNGADSGHVRIYDWNGTSWDQVADDIDGEAAGDWFGIFVSLTSDGHRVAIGAAQNDGQGVDSGHVRIYDWNGGSWVQVGADIDAEAPGDNAGVSVSLSRDGSRVAVGADGNDDAGIDSGHVRVSELNGGTALAACSPSTTSYTSGSTIYTVVAFTATGTCEWTLPTGATTFDYLVVGGGGGGGSWHGGGGGAGGLKQDTGLTVPLDTSFTIQVGAGGAGAPILTSGSPTAIRGSSGQASRITGSSSGSLVTVLGGGGGGSGTNIGTDGNDGAAGGSGGGAQAAFRYGGTVGAGEPGEGNDGGTGAGGGVDHDGETAYVAGGGGGAGNAGGGAGELLGDVRAGNGGSGSIASWLTASAATALGVGEVSGDEVYCTGGGARSG